MFMLKIYRYITGYVKFSGHGSFPERFLNLCAIHSLTVIEPKVDFDKIQGIMSVADYKKTRLLRRKSCMRIHIDKKIGLPFVVKKYKKRYGILVGVVAFFLTFMIFGGLCLNISVNGNDKYSYEQVVSCLEKSGIEIGMNMKDIDPYQARVNFLRKNPQFSWVAFNKKGCFLTVEISETNLKKMNKTPKFPCNIVAKLPGEIVSIKAYEGALVAKVGTAVGKGDLLVSGTVELTNKTTKFVHASAQVIAKTRRKLKVFVPYKSVQKQVEEKSHTRTVFSLANIDIPLFLGEIKGEYKAKREVKEYFLLGVRLPYKKTTATFRKVYKKQIVLSKSQAKILAKEKMQKKAKNKFGNNIKQKLNAEFKFTDKGVYYTQIFICEENIAKEQKILK